MLSLLCPSDQAQAQALLPPSTSYARVWRALGPWVQAFGAGDGRAAVSYLRALGGLFERADGTIERDDATRAFQTEALGSVADFDLEEFFERLPGRDGPYRWFALQGTPLTHGYRFRSDARLEHQVTATSARRGFGDTSGVVRMRHREADDKYRYLLDWRAGMGVGALSWNDLALGYRDGLAMLQESQISSSLPIFQKVDDELKKTQPALGKEDRQVLAPFWTSFPELAKLLSSLSRVEDVLVLDAVDPGTTRVRFVARWDLVRMARSYPKLAGFLEDFGKLLEGTLRLLDADGNTLLEVHFDTEHMRSRIDVWLRDGELVASRAGKPVARDAARDGPLQLRMNMHVQQYGLQIDIDDLIAQISHEQHGTGASLFVQMKHTPRFRVRGRAFGVFPAGMLDWFVPGDIEGLARKMMDVSMKGNGGRGVTVAVRFERPAAQLASLDGAVAFEILDTALIRFGMRIAADRLMPDEEETKDIARLVRALRRSFSADVERFAKYGIATPPAGSD